MHRPRQIRFAVIALHQICQIDQPDVLLYTDGEMRPIHEANHYLWHVDVGGRLAKSSLRKYACDIADCYRYFEAVGVPLLRATSVHLQEYFSHMERRGVRATTINGRVQSIVSFFRFLAARGYIITIPFTERIYRANSRGILSRIASVAVTRTSLQRREPSDQGVKVVCRSQLREFIARMGCVRNKAMAQLMWATGMRVAEIVAFSVHQLPRDLAEHVSEERPFLATIVGKGGRRRQVEIPAAVLRALFNYIEADRPKAKGNEVFVDSLGIALTTGAVQAAFRRMSGVTGIKVKPHDFRHGFAVERLLFWERIFDEEERKAGEGRRGDERELLGGVRYKALKMVQIELGHSSITTTEEYIKYLNRYKQAAQQGHRKFMRQLLEGEQ